MTQEKGRQVALDQLRCIDKNRLVKKLGRAPDKASQNVAKTLTEMLSF